MAESDGTRRWLLNSKLRPLLLLPSPPLPPHISHINPNKQHNQNGAETRRRYSIKAATMRIRRRCHYVTRYNKWRLRRQIYRPSPGGFNMARHVSIDVIKSLIFPLWWHPTSPTPPPTSRLKETRRKSTNWRLLAITDGSRVTREYLEEDGSFRNDDADAVSVSTVPSDDHRHFFHGRVRHRIFHETRRLQS